jgi:hypothetical protein
MLSVFFLPLLARRIRVGSSRRSPFGAQAIAFHFGRMCPPISRAIVWQRRQKAGQIHIDRFARTTKVCRDIDW